MRKFRIVRNILIIVIIIIAFMYIFFVRNTNIKSSKTFKTFDYFNFVPENKQVTMIMEYHSNDIDLRWTFATDFKEKKEVLVQDINFKDKSGHAKHIWINDSTGLKHWALNYETKTFTKEMLNDEPNFDNCTHWFDTWILNEISKSKYYTKKYELINNHLFYVEEFKNSNMKFYYDKDTLVYVQLNAFKEAFNGKIDNAPISIILKYDNSYLQEIEIPNDYTEQTLLSDGDL